MPDYEIGTIPPISVWRGETVKFWIKRRSGTAPYKLHVTPTPKGQISIDEEYGDFSYTASPEDREALTVSVKAGDGRLDEQTFTITPLHPLPADFNIIEHVSEPPDPASRTYMSFAEVDAGKILFNNTADFEKETDAQIQTKHVTISGVRLVFEQSDDAGSIYRRLNGRTDLRELTICADEVIFRAELNVPGTEVAIYARSLKFEGNGRINTTPLAVKATAGKRDEALRGQSGGNVYVLVQKVEVPQEGLCLIMKGGDGQPARQGRKGKDGTPKAKWDGKYFPTNGLNATPATPFDVSGKIRQIANGHEPVSAELWRIAGLSPPYKEHTIVGSAVRDDLNAIDEVPTSGTGPSVYPGHPGHGGDGGKLFTTVPDALKHRVDWSVGNAGKRASNVEGTKAGEPRKWCVIKAQYYARTVFPDIDFTIVMFQGTTSDGEGAIAPSVNPATPSAKSGWMINADEFTWDWVHPATVRALIPYAQDMILSGHTEGLVDLLTLYRNTLRDVRKQGGFAYKVDRANKQDKFVASTLEDELSALIRQVEGPYDYFGNPAGWVPMLNFQANKTLFKNELDDAIKAMFLAHWIEHTQQRQQKAANVLSKALLTLRSESDQALADYDAAQLQVDDLQQRLNQINNELGLAQQSLEATESQTRQQIQHDAQLEHVLRSSGKILGGVLQLIPVGQPVAGAFGKSFTALSDIDLENKKDSAGKIIGPLATVAGTAFANKAKKVYEELKTAKKKEETEDQKEFNKALAEERLEKRVDQFLEEEKEAKDQIVKALGGFAVPEDEIEERLERILAECPAYKKDIDEIKKLNKKKAVFTEDLLAALQTIELSTTTLLKNQLSLIKLRSQLDVALAGLNLEALEAVRGIGQRARDRLLLYQYYLVKSYQYLMLEDLPQIDYRCQKLFDSFVSVVLKTSGQPDVTLHPLADSTTGMLDDKQFEAVSTVFRNQLRDIGAKIITWYQTHPPKRTGEFPVSLTNEQLETLNAHGYVEIDLAPRLNWQREDIRITSVTTRSIRLAEPLPTTTVGFSLTYRHDGVSRIRRGGWLYLFRSGQYRVAGDGEASPDQYRNDKIYWASDITYDTAKPVAERLGITETQVDKEEQSLVRELITGNKEVQNPLVSFRPSAWTRLRITRSGQYSGKITDLTLNVSVVAHMVDERLSTVVVLGDDDIQPLIRCDRLDVNQCSDGYGTFVRTFDSLTSRPVTLKAPARYGLRSFVGWKMGRDALALETAELIKDSNLVLKLDQRDYFIRAVYSAVEFVPTDVKNQNWPPCPVGWKFTDWVLENRSAAPITISRIVWPDGNLNFPNGCLPLVNEPQGNEEVKLSFDRLMVNPQESVRISVCANPAATSHASEITFGWNVDGIHYAVFFNGQGQYMMSRKRSLTTGGWSGTAGRTALDMDNRVLTFKIAAATSGMCPN